MTNNKKGQAEEKSQAQVVEDYRLTRPCRKCNMPLVDPKSTLGHSEEVCRRYKAGSAREAAAKAKKGANKATKK